jgi:hypothetical protein
MDGKSRIPEVLVCIQFPVACFIRITEAASCQGCDRTAKERLALDGLLPE